MRRKKENKKLITLFGLPKEVAKFGYKFSFLQFAKYLIAGLLLFGILGYLFRLKPLYIGIVGFSYLLLLPGFLYDFYRVKYEKKRFDEAERYIENVVYSFSQSKKIQSALEDTLQQYPDGSHMKDCIKRSIDYIIKGKTLKTDTNLYREAFRCIENDYRNARITDVNDFMINVENTGGNIELPVKLLQEDKQNWYNNVLVLQQKKKKKYHEIMASAIVCTLLCLAFILFESKLPEKMQLNDNIVQLLSCTALLVGMQIIVKKGSSKLAVNWLDSEKRDPDKQIIDNYNYLINFKLNLKKEKFESCVFASPFLIGILPLLYFHHKWIALIAGVIGIAMLFQHKLNYKIAYIVALKELKVAFPKWLLQLLLLLQNNNVSNSLQKSVESAPAIMKVELEQLVEKIGKNPTKIESFNDFFKIFQENDEIKEIQRAMQVLYSISQTGAGNGQEKLNNLVDSIYIFRKISDEIMSEDALTDMNLTFKAPFALGALKLLCDAGLFLCVALPAFAQ